MEKQKPKPNIVSSGSIFAIAKNYEHGARSSETVRPGEEPSSETQRASDISNCTDRRKAMRIAHESSER